MHRVGGAHLIRITAGEHGLADGIVGHRTRARALLSGVKRPQDLVVSSVRLRTQ
jgi:hypothetical protein